VLDSEGAIYGTTQAGGLSICAIHENQGCGTAFKLEESSKKSGQWMEAQLHLFGARKDDGLGPSAGLALTREGALLGATFGGGGGNYPSGTVFQLVPHSHGKWAENALYSFQDNRDGGQPQSGVVFDSGGNLYGTASDGGAVGNGTVFRLRPGGGGSWTFAALYDFAAAPDGAYPTGPIFVRAGSLYGTTQRGGSGQACGNYGCGTVFSVSQ
jgi:uncharacterized repeat protein (TIGR03803 family)